MRHVVHSRSQVVDVSANLLISWTDRILARHTQCWLDESACASEGLQFSGTCTTSETDRMTISRRISSSGMVPVAGSRSTMPLIFALTILAFTEQFGGGGVSQKLRHESPLGIMPHAESVP